MRSNQGVCALGRHSLRGPKRNRASWPLLRGAPGSDQQPDVPKGGETRAKDRSSNSRHKRSLSAVWGGDPYWKRSKTAQRRRGLPRNGTGTITRIPGENCPKLRKRGKSLGKEREEVQTPVPTGKKGKSVFEGIWLRGAGLLGGGKTKEKEKREGDSQVFCWFCWGEPGISLTDDKKRGQERKRPSKERRLKRMSLSGNKRQGNHGPQGIRGTGIYFDPSHWESNRRKKGDRKGGKKRENRRNSDPK